MSDKPIQAVKCQHEGCEHEGIIECFLPCEDEPLEILCEEHASQHGFCRFCGQFWAGIESFDFLHPGLCDNCHDQLQDNETDEDEPDYWDEHEFDEDDYED